MSRLRAPVALFVVTIGTATLVIAFAIVKAKHVYVGGLAWPFISDLGRDAPASYVFFFGLSAVGVLLGLAWTFNHEYQHRVLQKSYENGQVSECTHSLSYVSCVFGVIGAIGLPLFASFDTSPAIHETTAVVFLATEATAMYVDTYLNYKIFQVKREELDTGVFITDRDGPRSVYRAKSEELRALQRGFTIELASISVFTVSVLVYLPLLYSEPPQTHLTIAEVYPCPLEVYESNHWGMSDCLTKELGTTYCTQTVRLDATNTRLWSYENALDVNQLFCILTLLTYALSFVANNKCERESLNERDRIAAIAKFYASQASGEDQQRKTNESVSVAIGETEHPELAGEKTHVANCHRIS
uniref:CWH43-like N-terminal domain-containing protein n=1 Tax=Globisporangium ultimum (strain ATCC 200006 / CBS 805.95 / DAOM BR144) TaxID=431595 RepID=K3WXH7_GLOUD